MAQPEHKPEQEHNVTLVFIVGTEKLAPHPYAVTKTLGDASEDALRRAHAAPGLQGYELIRESTGTTLSYSTKIGDPKLALKENEVLRLRRPKGANA